ncbi:MAG: hypothetical protein WC187_09640, partial [Bacillota bacterium]
KITSTTIESPLIVGGEVRGGSITSDTDIHVTTDAIIGRWLWLPLVDGATGIKWGTSAAAMAGIWMNPSGSLVIDAPGEIYANGQRIDTPPVAVFG